MIPATVLRWRMNDQEIGIVSHDSQQYGANYPVDTRPVVQRGAIGMRLVGIGHQHRPLLAVVTGHHHEMAGRCAAHIVRRVMRAVFACRPIKIGRTQTRQDRQITA